GTQRLVAALAKLVKKLGAKNAEALAWSAIAEMAGALGLLRPVSAPTGGPKTSGIRARWFDRALASIDRHHAAGDGSGRPHARLIADDNAGSYDRHIETLTGCAHQTLLNLGAGRGAVPVSYIAGRPPGPGGT